MKIYLVAYETYNKEISKLAQNSPLYEPRVKEFGRELSVDEFLGNYQKYLGNSFCEEVLTIGDPDNLLENVARELLTHDLSYTWLYKYAEDDSNFREDAENLRYALNGVIDAILRKS